MPIAQHYAPARRRRLIEPGITPPAFTPAQLFKNGEQGGYYDISVLSSLWQDAAGTIPVTADGQLVERVDDLSGNGTNLFKYTGPGGPLMQYKTDGSSHWLENVQEAANGLPAFLSNAPLTIKVPFSSVVGIDTPQTTGSDTWYIAGIIRGISPITDFMFSCRRADVAWSATFLRGANMVPSIGQVALAGTNNDMPANVPATMLGEFVSGSMTMDLNGVQVMSGAHTWTTQTDSGGALSINCAGLGMRLSSFIGIDRVLTAQEKIDANAWANARLAEPPAPPKGVVDINGPAPTVQVTFTGGFVAPTQVFFYIAGDVTPQWEPGTPPFDAKATLQTAAEFATDIGAAMQTLAGADAVITVVDGTVTADAAGANSTLTVTSLIIV